MKKVKVHKITLMVVDHDGLGEKGVREVLQETRYPNRCISPEVVDVETREVDWTDAHPLNMIDGWRAAYDGLFSDEKCDG